MKKALQISIAQTLFTIEEDAYAILDSYLQSIRAHFSKTEDSAEIVRDIETRISEQFLEFKKNILTTTEVNAVISSMGKVEDFDDDISGEHSPEPSSAGKKFYRSSEDKVIAGVCSGLGKFLNIDSVWVRIAFVVLTFITNGFAVLVYIILAILIPEARTTSQKLEMEGSKINLETISENFKERVSEVRENHGSTIRKVLAWPFEILGRFFRFVGRIFLPVVRISAGLALTGFSILCALFLSIATPIALLSANKHFDFDITAVLSTPLSFMLGIGVYLCAMIPLAVLFLLGLAILKRKNYFTTNLILVFLFSWCALVIGTGIASYSAFDKLQTFTDENSIFENSTRDVPLSTSPRSVHVESGVRLVLIQGPDASLTIAGTNKELDRFGIEEKDGALHVSKERIAGLCLFCNRSGITATLTLPEIDSLDISGGSYLTVDSWETSRKISIDLRNGSSADIQVASPEVELSAKNGSRYFVNMETKNLETSLENGSRIEILGTIEKANITAESGSRAIAIDAKILAAQIDAKGGSLISIGDIESLDSKTSGGGRVNRVTNSGIEED